MALSHIDIFGRAALFDVSGPLSTRVARKVGLWGGFYLASRQNVDNMGQGDLMQEIWMAKPVWKV